MNISNVNRPCFVLEDTYVALKTKYIPKLLAVEFHSGLRTVSLGRFFKKYLKTKKYLLYFMVNNLAPGRSILCARLLNTF